MAHFFSIVFVFAITTLFYTPSGIANKEIPSRHPRVYLTKNDLNEVRKKIETLYFMETWKEIKKIEHPFVRAFEGLVTMNQQMMAEAAKNFLPLLKNCTDARQPFNEVQLGSCIYDWCYHQMSDSLKLTYINEFKRIVGAHSPYFPARKGSNVIVGHTCEAWIMSNQLPAGLAIYDEDPVMYDSAAAVFFEEIAPVRNFVYQSHMNHQGDSYGAVRLQHDLFAAWLYKKMGKDVFSDDLQFVPYQLIYNYRPDGQQMRSGDTFDDVGNGLGGRAKAINQKSLVFGLCGSLYHNPYQLDMLKQFKENDFQKVFDLIFLPLDYQTKPIANLPLTKFFPHPMGEMITRTGWKMGVDSPDAVVQMRIGNYYFGNHQHKDFGTFQIYYKGPLAISSGIYQGNGENYGGPHWTNYLQQTISKNGLLVFNPDETISRTSVNDGGQHWPNNGSVAFNLESLLDENNGYKMGEVTAYDFGPDRMQPIYSYIAGDITAAYDPQKVDRITRAMLTINTGDSDFPALFFVLDRIVSDRAEYKKTWLLHSIQEPDIIENAFTISRTGPDYKAEGIYNGKLICRTILPQNATITKVGGAGREFWVGASKTNYYVEKDSPASEPGAWRIEVSPAIAEEDDLFFHAMAVTQADNKRICDFEPINAGTYKAVKINKYLVMFNSGVKGSTDVQFTLDGDLHGVFIDGLSPGDWEILRNGSLAMKRKVTDSAQCTYFEGLESGAYHLTKIN